MIKAIKKITLFLFFFGFFLILNSGFKFDSWDSLFQTLFFTLMTLLLISQPWLKKVFIILSVILFVMMVVFFIFDLINVANFFGSLGFGVLIISGLFYLQRLLKHGYL